MLRPVNGRLQRPGTWDCRRSCWWLWMASLVVCLSFNRAAGGIDLLSHERSSEEDFVVEMELMRMEEGEPIKRTKLDVILENKLLNEISESREEEEESPNINNKGKAVVEENYVVRLVVVAMLGMSVGLLCGLLVSVIAFCCYVKCSGRSFLEFSKHKNTYRSADLIDGLYEVIDAA